MDEPLTELAACFRSKSRLPGQDLVRLTEAARAAGSRWEAIAAACGVQSYKDLGGWSTGLPARPARPARTCCSPRPSMPLNSSPAASAAARR